MSKKKNNGIQTLIGMLKKGAFVTEELYSQALPYMSRSLSTSISSIRSEYPEIGRFIDKAKNEKGETYYYYDRKPKAEEQELPLVSWQSAKKFKVSFTIEAAQMTFYEIEHLMELLNKYN